MTVLEVYWSFVEILLLLRSILLEFCWNSVGIALGSLHLMLPICNMTVFTDA